jgi:hypothetical protein
MGFDVLTVRSAGNDDGAMYPVIGGRKPPIAMEEIDGHDLVVWHATTVAVGEVSGPGILEICRIPQIKADVVLTDSRVAVVCAKYVKALGGLLPGVTDVAGPRHGSAAGGRLAHRRKTRMLVGHVRFPWLSTVGANPGHGVRAEEQVRLTFGENEGGYERLLTLDLTLPQGFDSLEVARTIVRRAAMYRLVYTSVPEADVAAFEALARAGRLVPDAKQFAFYTMPSPVWANPGTAYPTVAGRG